MAKKKKSKVLLLKIFLEDRDIAEEELQLGVNDITRILSEFRKEVNDNQKEEFDNYFFGITPQSNADNPSEKCNTSELVAGRDTSKNSSIKEKIYHDPWVKNLYKKVVQRTHPDRFIDFPIQEIKEKFTKVYIDAVCAYERDDIGTLLLCAYEAEVEVDHPDAEKYLDSSIGQCKKRLSDISNLIGYQWYHTPEINRIPFLKAYLIRLGYKFNEKAASEAIKKTRYIKRKVGKRPDKNRVKRGRIS